MPAEASSWAVREVKSDDGNLLAATVDLTAVHDGGSPWWERYIARNWKRYEMAELEHLEDALRDAFADALKARKGLFLFGGTGRGKTHALVAIYRYLNRHNAFGDIALTSWLDMRDAIQADFDKPAEVRNEASFWRNVDVLLVDDLANGRMTQWGLETLAQIIEHRQRNDRLTYFTSNYALAQLPEVLNSVYGSNGLYDGDRIASRIAEMCNGYKFEGHDRRMA